MITLEMAFETPIGKAMKENDHMKRLVSPKHSFLAICIMQERRKESSPFSLYLDILPKNVDDFPIFFGDEELELLKGSSFLT